MSDGNNDFAVTEEYQAKVLAYMLQNPEFRDVAGTHLEVEHFNNKALQWYFTAIAQSEHHLTPILLKEELSKAVKEKSIREEEISKFVTLFDIIQARVIPSEEDYITDKIGSFIRTQSVKKALMDSVELAKNSEWDEIVGMMQDAVLSGVSMEDQGYDYLGEIIERVEDRATHRAARKIPSGIPDLDALTYGGIKNGQMGMVVGGTGRGKSIFLQWLARTALLLNKKVVYFTFELGKLDIADRMDSMFSKVKPQELNDYQQQVIEEITKLKETYGKSLIIQHYPADTATIHTLKDFCRRLSQAGIVPDLVIIDYLDLMKPHREYSSEHAEIDAITKGIVGFASEFDTSVWTATQMNRSGMVSESPDEAGMAGYIGKQYHADMVLWMVQTREEKEDEAMRLWVSKNRNGRVGTINLNTDYSYMTFYHEAKVEDEDGRDPNDPDDTTTEADPVHGKDDLQLLLTQSESAESSDTDGADG
jgi:replicative DNA helicase